MGLLEILLFLAGITICIVSFIIPAKREEQLEETKELAKEEIKELVNQELTHVKEHVEGTVDETITYAVEKTERFMDRMTNEKMMALNEYSDTVMEEIHKSHNEVMFLYDMLNDKHETIKNTAAEVDKAVKAVKDMPHEAEVMQNKAVHNATVTNPKAPVSIREQTEQRIREALAGKGQQPVSEVKSEPEPKPVLEPDTKSVSETIVETAVTEPMLPEVDLNFSSLSADNSNEQILRMHKEGKSKVAIAKELGLGVGEVKLVIDLFDGM